MFVAIYIYIQFVHSSGIFIPLQKYILYNVNVSTNTQLYFKFAAEKSKTDHLAGNQTANPPLLSSSASDDDCDCCCCNCLFYKLNKNLSLCNYFSSTSHPLTKNVLRSCSFSASLIFQNSSESQITQSGFIQSFDVTS